MQEFNVQFKNWLNQLSYHTNQSKKMKSKNKTKQNDEQLSPEMVTKNPWDPPEKVRETMVWRICEKKVSFESGVKQRWSDA